MKIIRSGVIAILITLVIFTLPIHAIEKTERHEWPQWTKHQRLDGLDIMMRGLSKVETKKLFDARGKRLLRRRKSIRPIEVVIRNETGKEEAIKIGDILRDINFSTPLRDVSHIVEISQKKVSTKLAFGLLGIFGMGVGVFMGYVGCLSLIGCGLKPAMLFGLSVNDVWMPWTVYIGVPISVLSGMISAADYLYSIAEGYRRVTQSILIKPGHIMRAYIFVDAKALM